MANFGRVYECTRCGRRPAPTLTEAREGLTVKRVMFTEMGMGGKTLRSRVTEWLCAQCRESDPDFNLPKFVAPGNRSAKDSAPYG
jgi:hypothetical protein